MKKWVLLGLVLGALIFGGIYWYFFLNGATSLSPVTESIEKVSRKPLDKYSFENLKKTEFKAGAIEIGEKVEEDSDLYDSYIFYFPVENLNDSDKPLRASGLMNVPVEELGEEEAEEEHEYPVIVQFRGFVAQEDFVPGAGSARSGQYFAENGFITLAPDFLGYGESDMPSQDSLEERFQTYTTALSLLASVKSLNDSLSGSEIEAKWDERNIGVWGHSNGGHIALSALAISGLKYPLVLWNPVSKPFPYSILYYTDEYDDNGRALRALIAEFEHDYDIELYSPPNYYKWLSSPIQIHQGALDQEVLPWWSLELAQALGWEEDQEDGDIEYIEHANSDHNLMPGGWEDAVRQSVEFYKSKFESGLEEEGN